MGRNSILLSIHSDKVNINNRNITDHVPEEVVHNKKHRLESVMCSLRRGREGWWYNLKADSIWKQTRGCHITATQLLQLLSPYKSIWCADQFVCNVLFIWKSNHLVLWYCKTVMIEIWLCINSAVWHHKHVNVSGIIIDYRWNVKCCVFFFMVYAILSLRRYFIHWMWVYLARSVKLYKNRKFKSIFLSIIRYILSEMYTIGDWDLRWFEEIHCAQERPLWGLL